MEYFLTDEQKRLKETVRTITQEVIIPAREKLDVDEKFPVEIMERLNEANMFKLFIPKEQGGLGMGNIELCLVVEELSKGCAGIGTTYAANALATTPIILFGNTEQKNKYLSRIANGVLASFALTEAEAGSDAGSVRTTAKKHEQTMTSSEAIGQKEDNFYVLNGTKQWITNGGEAEIYVVIASTNPDRGARGLSAFIVEKETDGFSCGKLEDKLGIRASCTRELIFDNCKIPAKNLIGKEGVGFMVAMRTFDYTRPGVGALAVGIAQGAIDTVTLYAKEFKKSRAVFEKIAELATKVEAARALVYQVAKYADSEAKDLSKYSAMSKLFASDTAIEVTGSAMEILGIDSCIRKYGLEKFYRDAKISQIYEGTNEIQKLVIARSIAK